MLNPRNISGTGRNNKMIKQTQMKSGPPRAEGHRWAVILAGGDGKRLLPLTRKLSGDDRPKQFCRVLGNETLLDRTLRRVERIVSPDRTFSVVTRAHRNFYSAHAADLRYAGVLVQPLNRGTSPAIVYSLVRLHEIDPRGAIAFFPSDHHFTDDEALAHCVREAFEFAESHTSVVILLGIAPSSPETEYGWIEPAEPLMATAGSQIFSVRRFWEKPPTAIAIDLIRRGCFWNSFIMVGRVASFMNLAERAVPSLVRSFQDIAPVFFTGDEQAHVRDIYRNIPPSNFATDALSAHPDSLAVLCNKTLEWTDVGDVDRALSLMEREPIPVEGSDEPEIGCAPAAAG
jgi:mannose-1-phosphate guanylyltransferase